MADTDHIFTPQDDSLAERIRAYRSVAEAYRNAEASLKHMNNDEWSDQLGEKQEIKQAHEICQRSFQIATQSISQDELQQAIEHGLLSDEEVRELIQSKRLGETKRARESRQTSESTRHSQKR